MLNLPAPAFNIRITKLCISVAQLVPDPEAILDFDEVAVDVAS